MQRKNDQIPSLKPLPVLSCDSPDAPLDGQEPTLPRPHRVADQAWDVLVVDEPWEPEPEPGDFPSANQNEGDD